MLHRKLTALAAGASAVLIVLSAFAQTNGTAPHKKKKKKKPKHTTSAPAASATAEIELDAPPAAAAPPAAGATPAPAASAPEPAGTKAAGESSASGEATASASSDHDTAGPASAGHVDIGALLGWGFNGGARFGLGLRGGYTLPMNLGPGHLYVGATFVYHFGESEFGGTANFFYPGVEVGYELHLGPLLVRPYAGLGPMILHESLPPITNAGVTVAQGSSSKTYFAFWPGAQVTYPVTPMVFLGGDARYIFSGYSMFGLFATGGVRF